MPQSLADRKRELDMLVEGWIDPVFKRTDPHTGRILNGLSPADYHRVTSGYACADCLAKFTTYLIKCPVCGWQRNLMADIEDAPGMWEDHLKDREPGGVAPYRRPSMENLLDSIHADKDIEHTTVKKLKPRRRK